ncbi:MAG: ferrochelatase [Acidobacteria bacterium]|nr:ferrochelatase [Acidobacteriota bacterium]
MNPYDALLLVSFGGPEKREDVMPFLEVVTRGRAVTRERLLEVVAHYHHFGGRSPINEQNRALAAALETELAANGVPLPVYLGNRNWHPFLADTVLQMKRDGVRRALAFVTSAFSSYSGCRQYKENIAQARAEAGDGAPEIDKIRVFHDHPEYLEVIREETLEALKQIPGAYVLFTAHSIPVAMAGTCRYVQQLEEASRRVAAAGGLTRSKLVYQSRGGPPVQPWLEPDVLDAIRALHAEGVRELVLVPIGFVSDHLEVLYDLDTAARGLCGELGIRMARASTAGTHPRFVRMIRDLVVERIEGRGVVPGLCTPECCPPPGPLKPAASTMGFGR